MSLKENLRVIENNVQEAVVKSKNANRRVRIIAVTKNVSVQRIQEAVSNGLFHLGENRVQEMTGKMEQLDLRVKWHMIGHLQRNKVKYIVEKVHLIHSIDSLSLMREIDRRGRETGRVIDGLIQINVSGEKSKFGIDPDQLSRLLLSSEDFSFLKIRGLMTMAPHFENPEKTRDGFKKLYDLFMNKKETNPFFTDADVLSMGMSNDYQVAIEEGATMIRIGSALFGERHE